MNYLQYTFTVTPPQPGSEILIACIADLGFESFENTDNGFVAYIPETIHPDDEIKNISYDDFSFSFTCKKIEQVNWNEEWEKNFDPVMIGENCCISAPFHHLEKKFKHNIVIMPKMSFGTGHHDTTWLVCKNMLDLDLKNKKVLDMGCGTGVLAILAKQLGANAIVGIDIDDWSVENAIENCSRNNCSDIKIIKGDGKAIEDHFDVILANINKNILKAELPVYAQHLNKNGYLILSGFFKTDSEELIALATQHSLSLFKQENKNDWAVLLFKKT